MTKQNNILYRVEENEREIKDIKTDVKKLLETTVPELKGRIISVDTKITILITLVIVQIGGLIIVKLLEKL